MRFKLRADNKSGIILIVVLWILVILSVVAVGLGRTARIDLALTKHRIGKLKADFLLWGAFNYAMNQIRVRGSAPERSADTLYQCGFELKDAKTSRDLFKDVPLNDGSFDISYILKDEGGRAQACYGFQDEERRININTINQGNYRILVNLFDLLNVDKRTAQAVAAQIVDWQDADAEVTDAPYGAEGDDYRALLKPYACKDRPFESVEELLLLKDMTPQVFAKIKDHVTVIAQEMMFRLNVNTAPAVALKALFQFIAEKSPGIRVGDIDSIAEKITAYRNGDDRMPCTADDRAIDSHNVSPLGFNANENALYLTASAYLKDTSDYFRVCASAADSQYAVSSKAEAVIAKENLAFLLWRRK